MRKTTFIILCTQFLFLAIVPDSSRGLEVDVDEIKSKRVNFINYQGRIRKIDSVAEIRKIGIGLAEKIKKTGPNRKVKFHMKYSVVRAISKKEPDKFSADILSIDRDARVGHIKNIRRIIAGYLQSLYGYTYREAYTLAVFTTYYNAVHRGDVNFFSGKYKKIVIRHINKRNAGIATKWSQWPGRTKMIIPLTQESKRKKIDPDEIADKKTIKEVRKDKKNIKHRKDLNKIRKKKLEDDKKKIDDEKKKITDEKKKITDEKKKLDDEKKKIEKEKKETKKITDKKKREKKEEEIKKKEKKYDEKKKEIEKKEKEIKRKEKKSIEKEKKYKKREKDIEDEKKKIKEDEKDKKTEKEKELEKKEKELDKREDKIRDKELDKKIYGTKLYYLKIKEYLEGGHYNNDLYMIEADKRKILFKSPVQYITGKRYDVFSGGVVVITHKGSHSAEHRLTLVDRETLKAKINGTDNVFWRSFIEVRGGFIHAIIIKNGQYYLGRFDGELKLVAQSDVRINENTFISFFDKYIYINRFDKTIIVLNREDLKFIDEVKPE